MSMLELKEPSKARRWQRSRESMCRWLVLCTRNGFIGLLSGVKKRNGSSLSWEIALRRFWSCSMTQQICPNASCKLSSHRTWVSNMIWISSISNCSQIPRTRSKKIKMRTQLQKTLMINKNWKNSQFQLNFWIQSWENQRYCDHQVRRAAMTKISILWARRQCWWSWFIIS